MKYNYKPSLNELRSSLKHRSKEYLLENSLHGVPYFADFTRPKWERIIWCFLTIASIISVVVIIVIILEKFQTEPTMTGLDVDTDYIDIEFPQIFVCFDWSQLNYSHLNENQMSVYENLYNWSWGKKIDLNLFEDFYENEDKLRATFESMAPDCNTLIKYCEYRGIQRPCDELLTQILTYVGVCCKFEVSEPLKNTDVSWMLNLQATSFPRRLYFTEKIDKSPKPGERPITMIYFPIDIEFIVSVTYTTPDIQYLTLRQRQCKYDQEGVNKCEAKCLRDKLYAHCNCLPWYLSTTDKKECSISEYPCLNEVSMDTNQCKCWLSCDHTSYTVKGITKSNTNMMRIMLRNWPTALYKREMRFGYLDLLVSFGGIASLFLGYSLLTSIELGYYFSLRTYCGAVIQSSRKKHIIKVRVAEKLPRSIEFAPKYYQYTN